MKNDKKETTMLMVSSVGLVSLLLVSMQYLTDIQISETVYNISRVASITALSIIVADRIISNIRYWSDTNTSIKCLMVFNSLVEIVFLSAYTYVVF